MPPAGKGKGKKTRGLSSSLPRHDRNPDRKSTPRPRSRNSSPSSTTAVSEVTAFSESNLSYQEIVERYLTTSSGEIPQSTTLLALQSDLSLLQVANRRREARTKEKLRLIQERIRAKREEGRRREQEREEARRKLQLQRERGELNDSEDEEDTALAKIKKKDRPLSAGSGSVVGRNGEEKKKKKRKAESPLRDDNRSSTAGASPRKKPRASPSDYAPNIPPYDPMAADPTVYEIEEVTPETSVEDRKRIYRVASFPMIDLKPMQPGIPPDEDFSKAKPANQVTLNAFNTMIEPYFRAFTEEDEAFLRERGDRVTPYIMPPLGRRYKEVWAETDGSSFASPAPALPPPNEPRGNPDLISDEILEKEDVSAGPLLSRVLAAMIAEDKEEEEKKEKEEKAKEEANKDEKKDPPPSATALPPIQTDPTLKLPPSLKTDYANLEKRLVEELKYLGLLSQNANDPSYKSRQDDEVSARLRLLQAQLHHTSVMTGARKTRLEKLLQPQLAYQEYITIHDDLDKQVEQAYSKRTRVIKAKKKKVPPHMNGVASSAATALEKERRGIGEAARALMDKRAKWRNGVGPVFDEGITGLPVGSVFEDLDDEIRAEEEAGRMALEEVEGGEDEG